MSKIIDERLDELLENYHQIEPSAIPAFIPAEQKNQRVTLYPKRTVAAASVVLVAVLGVSIYFLIGNKTPIPVAPKTPVSATEILSEVPSFPASPTESGTVPGTTAETQKPTLASAQPATQIATDSRGNIIITTVTTRIDSTAAPTTAPTQSATQSATQKPQPTQAPSAKPTEAATPTHTSEPLTPSTEPPTETVLSDMQKLRFNVPSMGFPSADIEDNEDDNLYCAVYDSGGKLLGDSNLYSDSHLIRTELIPVSMSGGSSSRIIQYYEVEYDANQSPGNRFTYQVYVRNGTVLYEGTVTV